MPVSGFIAADPQSIKELQAMIDRLPDKIADPVTEDVADYLIDIFQIYPPYREVSRAEAFPDAVITTKGGKQLKGWFSWAQFRYVMMAINEGIIRPGSPHRTQAFRKGWKKVGKGRNLIIANEVPYGPYLKGPREQSRQMVIIGWTDIERDVAERTKRITERAHAALKKAIKKGWKA